ncbi:MAG: methionyl-tRNA formyltransferase [Nitrospira sp.]|nr:methionyl-tRNA formyltransferase [Candidatus Manganitrophaceae bacterium]HIL35765.1 methionyl-tRNA formyltransferase [Candidatus Manganitrophaceae bacterium]
MGTPDFALPSFEAICESENVIGVVTQPDRPKGRKQTLTPPPIKVASLEKGVPVYQPERLKKDPLFTKILSELSPDLIIVVAFGQILPETILQIPKYPCINVHSSLLPKYRGAAPIQWALVQGEVETGVTTMQMDKGMDTGPILLQRSVQIDSDETAEFLSARLAELGAELLLETVASLKEGKLKVIPQDDARATKAPLLKKEDGLIRWEESAQAVYNRWRGLSPWPGTVTFFGGDRWKIPALEMGKAEGKWGVPGEVLKLSEKGLEVAAGRGYILIKRLQPEGKRKMTPHEYAVGHHMNKGAFLVSTRKLKNP